MNATLYVYSFLIVLNNKLQYGTLKSQCFTFLVFDLQNTSRCDTAKGVCTAICGLQSVLLPVNKICSSTLGRQVQHWVSAFMLPKLPMSQSYEKVEKKTLYLFIRKHTKNYVDVAIIYSNYVITFSTQILILLLNYPKQKNIQCSLLCVKAIVKVFYSLDQVYECRP